MWITHGLSRKLPQGLWMKNPDVNVHPMGFPQFPHAYYYDYIRIYI